MTNKKTKITFLGTGSSTGVPNLYCLSNGGCVNCFNENNHRTITSILLYKESLLLIDCTKDFKLQYENYLLKQIKQKMAQGENKADEQRVFISEYDKNNIDEKAFANTVCPVIRDVLFTQSNADTILGLDSLYQTVPATNTCRVYADKETAHYLVDNFQYFFRKKANMNTKRMTIDIIEPHTEYKISDFVVQPFYVKREGGLSYMYLIDNKLLYIRDCSKFKHDISAEILIIECTNIDEDANNHLNLRQVLPIIDSVNPRITYLIGMSHLIDYEQFNKHVKTLDKNIVVAREMMEIEY